jgi:hypothetical protein
LVNAFIGGGSPVAQVSTYTFAGTWTASDVITFALGTSRWTFTTGSSVIATFLASLQAAFAALSSSVYPELTEMIASNTSSTFVLTAINAGTPFGPLTISTNSASGTIGGSSSSTGTTTVASAGPNDWSTAQNWSLGVLPVSGDVAVVDLDGAAINFGLDQHLVSLLELRIVYRDGQSGLLAQNPNGYPEYRNTYLKIGAATGTINSEQSQMTKVDFGSSAVTCTVSGSGTTGLDGQNVPAVLLKGSNATFNVSKGVVGIAYFAGETATANTLTVGQQTGGATDATVITGYGCTVTAANVQNGTVTIWNPAGTTLTMLAGNVTLNGTGAPAQLTIGGGTCVVNTIGTIGGNTVISGSGFIDHTQDPRQKSYTNSITVYGNQAGGSDKNQVINRPYTVIFSQGQGRWDYGPNRTLAIT